MKKIYIAGPMTGKVNYNYEEFDATAKQWEENGWAAINPAESFNRNTGLEHHEYLRAAVHLLLQADGIALMNGWENSQGAAFEAEMCRLLKIPAYNAHNFRLIILDYD